MMESGSSDGRFRSPDVPQMFPGCSTTPTWLARTRGKRKDICLKNNLRGSGLAKTDGDTKGETHASVRTGNISPLWRNQRSGPDFYNPKYR